MGQSSAACRATCARQQGSAVGARCHHDAVHISQVRNYFEVHAHVARRLHSTMLAAICLRLPWLPFPSCPWSAPSTSMSAAIP